MSPGLTHTGGIPIRHPCNWVSLPSRFALPFRLLVQFVEFREKPLGAELSCPAWGRAPPGRDFSLSPSGRGPSVKETLTLHHILCHPETIERQRSDDM
jgi:hypothetical protein